MNHDIQSGQLLEFSLDATSSCACHGSLNTGLIFNSGIELDVAYSEVSDATFDRRPLSEVARK